MIRLVFILLGLILLVAGCMLTGYTAVVTIKVFTAHWLAPHDEILLGGGGALAVFGAVFVTLIGLDVFLRAGRL